MSQEKSAGDFYDDILGADPRFSRVTPGFRGKRVVTFATLDALLGRNNGYPNWFIERGCVNLWGELMGAVLEKNATTNKFTEDLDKKCADHAITSAIYGLHTHLQLPIDNTPAVLDPQVLRLAKLQERIEASERNFTSKYEKSKSVRY